MNAGMIIAVAVGGAAGSVARYLTMIAVGHWFGGTLPWGTLAVNVIGSLVMGALIEAWALAWSPGLEVRALLTVGVLGGFTTFSTFSLDVANLIERQQTAMAAAYVAASVALSVGALFLGLAAMRQVLK